MLFVKKSQDKRFFPFIHQFSFIIDCFSFAFQSKLVLFKKMYYKCMDLSIMNVFQSLAIITLFLARYNLGSAAQAAAGCGKWGGGVRARRQETR